MKLETTKNGFSVRLRFGAGERKRFELPFIDEEQAQERADTLQDWANRMSKAKVPVAQMLVLCDGAAGAGAAELAQCQLLVDQLCHATEEAKGKAKKKQPATFRSVGEAWTAGKLAERFPDYIRTKRSANEDSMRLERLYESIGDVLIGRFAIDDADRAMASLPKGLKPATRRQYAQLISRVMRIAVYPLRLREANPIPAGWVPRANSAPRSAYLFPSEDAGLLACQQIPLERRMLWGFLAREGMRLGEALSLTWNDLDLKRGAVKLDKNKTNDPRAWALSRSVTAALSAFRPAGVKGTAQVFNVAPERMADQLRDDLKLAGVERAELYEKSEVRMPIRAHDLRSTFVTLSLANGKSETWVSDRTGHRSTQMISRYRRAARTADELELGELAPLDEAIPELNSSRHGDPGLHGNAEIRSLLPGGGFPKSGPQGGPQLPGLVNSISAKCANLVGEFLVGHEGLEPSANGLRVHCSTN